MEITEKNFKTQLPVVLKAIREADFLSFDCEFTGIGEGASMILPFDTPALVYAKAKANLNNYTVVQFGLCTFTYDPPNHRFKHRVFNFFVFPRLPKDLAGRLRKKSTPFQSFSCQADSLEFLADQKFDFNKWICEGVGFLKKSVVDDLKEDLNQAFNWRSKGGEKVIQPLSKIPDAHRAKVEALAKKVDEFYKSSEKQLVLENILNFEKRLLMNIAQNKYGFSLFFDAEVSECQEKSFHVKITKCSGNGTNSAQGVGGADNASNNNNSGDKMDHDHGAAEERNTSDQEENDNDRSAKNIDPDETMPSYEEMCRLQHEQKLVMLEGAAGFCNVISAISEAKKPLVGHNMYLDLLHMLKAFCCELPESYKEFKRCLRKWFPCIVDTKVLCAQAMLKKHFGFANSLSQIYKRLQQQPFRRIVSVPEQDGYSYEHCSENLHEAGYDAYLTGLIFISMADYKAIDKNKLRAASDVYDVAWDLIGPLFNKVATGRVVDMPYFDLSLSPESDMCPDRSHVFHFSFLREEWINDNIAQLFSPYGQIQIAWIDESSCFVNLKDRNQVASVLKNLIHNRPNNSTKSSTTSNLTESKRVWTLIPSIDYFKREETLIYGDSVTKTKPFNKNSSIYKIDHTLANKIRQTLNSSNVDNGSSTTNNDGKGSSSPSSELSSFKKMKVDSN